MVYEIIFKKRFYNKLQILLTYIEKEFGLLISIKFAKQLDKKLILLQKQPFMGKNSLNIEHIKSIHIGKHQRVYYRIEDKKIIVLNMYDTRINPKRNRLK